MSMDEFKRITAELVTPINFEDPIRKAVLERLCRDKGR
jgi:hypothetical protein